MTTEYLLGKEIERVIAALMPQNQLIVRVILHNGMRVSDVLNLKTADLALSGWYTEIKTSKRRRYGLPKELLEQIQEQAGDYWAFPGQVPGKHKTRQAVWTDIKRAQKAFRMPNNLGTHSFRKVYAVELYKKYGDIERVRRNLNHSSTSITTVYAMADMLLERRMKAKKGRKPPKKG